MLLSLSSPFLANNAVVVPDIADLVVTAELLGWNVRVGAQPFRSIRASGDRIADKPALSPIRLWFLLVLLMREHPVVVVAVAEDLPDVVAIVGGIVPEGTGAKADMTGALRHKHSKIGRRIPTMVFRYNGCAVRCWLCMVEVFCTDTEKVSKHYTTGVDWFPPRPLSTE